MPSAPVYKMTLLLLTLHTLVFKVTPSACVYNESYILWNNTNYPHLSGYYVRNLSLGLWSNDPNQDIYMKYCGLPAGKHHDVMDYWNGTYIYILEHSDPPIYLFQYQTANYIGSYLMMSTRICTSGNKILETDPTTTALILNGSYCNWASVDTAGGIEWEERGYPINGTTTLCDATELCQTPSPTYQPTMNPVPTESPTQSPTDQPTSPTVNPTVFPTVYPTLYPTTDPTKDPTKDPTIDPTKDPTIDPTHDPTKDPTHDPTHDPTKDPTKDPTIDPTKDPTHDPTKDPTDDPTTDPTKAPTADPTNNPTTDPTPDPTHDPTTNPTSNPTTTPTTDPTNHPTKHPTDDPTRNPTSNPTKMPTNDPTNHPTMHPTANPTSDPTKDPTIDPTQHPTIDPTNDPIHDPTSDPTRNPTSAPTKHPIVDPTNDPSTNIPAIKPTLWPTSLPTSAPTPICHHAKYKGIMKESDYLWGGESLVSQNCRYLLKLKKNGNLILCGLKTKYERGIRRRRLLTYNWYIGWSTNTSIHNYSGQSVPKLIITNRGFKILEYVYKNVPAIEPIEIYNSINHDFNGNKSIYSNNNNEISLSLTNDACLIVNDYGADTYKCSQFTASTKDEHSTSTPVSHESDENDDGFNSPNDNRSNGDGLWWLWLLIIIMILLFIAFIFCIKRYFCSINQSEWKLPKVLTVDFKPSASSYIVSEESEDGQIDRWMAETNGIHSLETETDNVTVGEHDK